MKEPSLKIWLYAAALGNNTETRKESIRETYSIHSSFPMNGVPNCGGWRKDAM